MLAFDIETTGLNKRDCVITVVCAEDFFSGRRYSYEFSKTRAEGGDIDSLTKRMCADFDAAPSLCAFNGVRFDLPFFESLGIPADKIAEWIVKTSDILEQCRLRNFPTFSLNMLCDANGIALKSSDGKHVITMAHNGQWAELLAYCADDVAILCKLYKRRFLKHPRTQSLMDTRDFAHNQLYNSEVLYTNSPSNNCEKTEASCVKKVEVLIAGMLELKQALATRDYSTTYIN